MRVHTFTSWLAAAFIVFILSSCASTRYSCSIKPVGDKTLHMGEVRFSIEREIGTTEGEDSLGARARELYPGLFTDDLTGLPVVVGSDAKTNEPLGIFPLVWGVCTVGVLPIPESKNQTCTVWTNLINSSGDLVKVGQNTYEFDTVQWFSVFSPLGLLPVIGPSDLPRKYESVFTGNATESSRKASRQRDEFLRGCVVETVVKSLRVFDQAALAKEYEVRKKRLQQIAVDGRQCWSFLSPAFPQGQGRADRFTAFVYQDYPKRGVRPLEEVVVARRDAGGAWHPVSGYLRSARTLTAASVLMENGLPSKVVVRAVDEPPLQDFIDLPEVTRNGYAADLQWSNGVLLEVKNRFLVKAMREKSGEELFSLATRIEKAILDLSTLSERAKDQAQAAVEQGTDPGPNREIAVLCRQRIEILKPILAAVKGAAAAKTQ